jgi:hypothetical protein
MKYRFLSIDSLDKAHDIIEALMEPRATTRLSALFRVCPEMADWTHREIAANSGLTRETVSRAMARMSLGRRDVMAEDRDGSFYRRQPREEAAVSV